MSSRLIPFLKLKKFGFGLLSLLLVVSGLSVITAVPAQAIGSGICGSTLASESGITSTVTQSGSFCIVKFTTSGESTNGTGTWTVPNGVTQVEYFVVGGGGGGGGDAGAGGGGGGFTEGTINLANQTGRVFSITVGAGGLRRVYTAYDTRYSTDSTNMAGTDGNPTSIQIADTSNNVLTVLANGGVKGAGGSNAACCATGGAGGTVSVTDNSAAFSYTATVSTTGGTGGNGRNIAAAGSGFNGGGGFNTSALLSGAFGGGGGGGSNVGADPTSGGTGANGGGSGASGTTSGTTAFSTQGTMSTGGGGGAGTAYTPGGLVTIGGVTDHSKNGAPGGSGVVVLRYSFGADKLNQCVAAINDPLYTNSQIATLMGYANQAALETAITNLTVAVWIASGAGTFGGSASATAPDLFCGDSNNNTVESLDSDPTTKDYFFGGAGNDSVTNSWLSVFYGGVGIDSVSVLSENSLFYGGPGADTVGRSETGGTFYQQEPDALTPTFGTPTATATGFTVNITNYDAAFTWATPTVSISSGSVAVTSTSGSNRLLTVSGLTPGTSATITQTNSRDGYTSGSATFTAIAALVIDLDATNRTSYSGSGSNWTNLVNGTNYTISNGNYSSSDGGAIVFNGTSTRVDLGTPLATGTSFTKEAWVKYTSESISRNILSSPGSVLYVSGSTLSGSTLYGGTGGSFSLVSSTSFPLNQWAHIVLTFNDSAANTMSLYLNGALVSTNASVSQSYTQEIERIGAHGNASSAFSFWIGSISKARIYNGALSGAQVTSRFDDSKSDYVAAVNQTISRTSTSPTSPVVGGTYTPTATSSSSLTVAISIAAGSSSVCSISSGTVTFNAVGSCVIYYNQIGNSSYNAATQVTETLSIGKGTPTFSWSGVSKTFGDSTFTVTAPTVAGSVPGSFTYSSATTSVISISGTTFTVAGAGTSVITASFTPTSTANYNSATTTMTVTVSSGAARTPTFGTPTATATGFTVQISNYSGDYTWAGTATASGSVAISGTGLVTVTGVAAGTSSTATITTARTGYTGGSATVSKTSLANFVTTYDATTNGGTAISPLTVSFTEGGTALTLPTPATRTGYTPSGWFTTASSGGSIVGDANTAYTPTSTATIFFRWSANTYTVTYDANSGSGSMSTQSITAGTPFQLSNNSFTKSNFTFDGWYLNSGNTGTRYNAGQSVTLFADQTYFAKWSATPRFITYAANGATGSVPTESSKSTGATFEVAAGTGLTRTGYDFAGWSDGGATVAVGSTYTVPAGNVTLTAQWTVQTYTIAYDGNNSTSGNPSRTSDSFVYGSSAIALPTVGTLARTGYTFAGWSATVNGSAISGNYTPTQSVTLHARWSANTYTTSYNTNGGSGTAPSNNTYTTSGAGFTLPAGTGITKTGYDFAGWSTTTTGSALSGAQTSTADQILYARWTIQTITATYAKGTASSSTFTNFPTNASGNYGTTITLDSTVDTSVSISGTTYVFQGWSDGTSTYQKGDTYLLGTGPITLTAQWVAIYGVRYTLNGGTAAAGDFAYDAQCIVGDNYCSNGQVIAANMTPTRNGYTFTGWKDQSNNSIAQAATFTVSAGTYLLYAQWTAISRTVTYALNDGSGSAPTETNKTINQTFTISNTVPTRSGYTFTGWSDSTLVYGPSATYTVANSNVTLTAQWSAISYSVTYDTNRGTSSTPTQANRNVAQTFAVAAAPTRAGYTFGKWNDGTNDYDPTNTFTMPAANVVLTATWTATSLTITYSVNGGSSTLPTESNKTIGNTFTLAAAATFANRDFLGWNDGATTYRAGATYTVGSSSITLTAVWSGTTFSVTYAGGGSTGGSVPTEVAKESGVYVTVKAHTVGSLVKTGHTFAGWSDGSNLYSANDSYLMNATAVVFTATWNRDAFMVTYVAGGSTGTLPTQSDVTAGASFTIAAGTGLSKSNFTFAGWSDGATTYAAGVSYTNIATDVTLTALWTAIANSGGGGGGGGGGSSSPTTGGPSNALNVIIEKVTGGQKVSWNNSSAVTIIVKSFNGTESKFENVSNSLEIPNPKPGESKQIVITRPGQPDQILETKTIYQAPLSAQNLAVKQMTNKSLQVTWKPSSTVIGYRVVITPTVGASVIVDTTDPKFAVQTAPGQKYRFEVIAIGAGGLESGTISKSASISRGKVVTPLLQVAQTISSKVYTQAAKSKLVEFAKTLEPDSSILCSGSASSSAGRAAALAAASRACATLQQSNPEIFVKPVVTIVSTKTNPKLAKTYVVGISVVIKPIG